MPTLEFYFDFGSPNAHIAHHRLPEIIERTGATLVPKIMLLGGVFQTTGNVSPMNATFKVPYIRNDMARFIVKHKIPFRMNPNFPVNTIKMMRGAVVAEEEGFLPAYMDACFKAMWSDGKNMADDAVIAETFTAAGFDAALIAQRSGEDPVKDKLKRNTGAACERGVFGAPTFFVGDEMFFGQDRLDFVEDALAGRSYLLGKKGAA